MPSIQTWGNSLAVRIPAALANQLSVTSGTEVDLSVSDGALLVKPAKRRKYRLSELLKNCRPRQLHGEMHFEPDVGREVID
ncbi:MAG: AbrB/MazE/SpoVT family DNA-binding domain-containing protein [Planctomycetaceae bacterium]